MAASLDGHELTSPFARRALHAIPDGKPLRTFPGIARSGSRNSGRKTALHFSWNCSLARQHKEAVLTTIRQQRKQHSPDTDRGPRHRAGLLPQQVQSPSKRVAARTGRWSCRRRARPDARTSGTRRRANS
ncbi:MAG: hypothetical protein EKK31_13625 [Hyphomicrobiales bacterium]|nr:MAG: hypothetical protein EKK31_13625 [Hyphomicrobiales bacterium]